MRIVSLGAAAVERTGSAKVNDAAGDRPADDPNAPVIQTVRLQPLQITLLAYMAVEGPKPRTHLAELFWQHSSNGLNSLSSTLSRIRRVAPAAVRTIGTTELACDLDLDVFELRSAIAAGDATQVAALYRGPFLANPGLRRLGSELEDWVLATRDTIVSEVEVALLRQARIDFEAGNIDSAADLAEVAYLAKQRDGVPVPEYFSGYYRMLAEGQRALAAEVRREAADYGIDLAAIEVELRAPAHQEPAHLEPADQMPVANLIGFEREQTNLREAITTHQATQIIGLGGSGKTSLAADLMADEVERGTTVKWVDLSPVEDPDLVEAAVASAFGVSLAPRQALLDVLDLSDAPLVVLDNFEHMADRVDVVEDLLSGSQTLRVVTTSRVPLELPEAAIVRLRGLELSSDEADAPARQLLITAAQRSGASIDDAALASLDEICELVGGLPLALELAGSWSRVLPAAEIARSLRDSSELLDPASSDNAQRSMQAVVAESLGTLDSDQRRALDQLAVLPVGCTVGDASRHLGLSVRVIGDLVDRSLVTVDRQQARLRLHPLIAQQAMAESRQDPELFEQLRATEAAWCRALTNVFTADSPSTATAELLTTIGPELANVMSAWRSAAHDGQWELIGDSLAAVREFFVVSGRLVEGQKALASTLGEARSSEPPVDLLVRLLEANAWLALLTGQAAQARALADEARQQVDLASGELENADAVSIDTEVLALRTMGTIDLTAGRIDAAAGAFERALALATPTTPRTLVAKLHDDIGNCREAQGRTDEARSAFRTTLDMGREIDDPLMVARGYLFLAGLEQIDNPQRCLVLLGEGLTVARDNGLDHLSIYFPLFAGQAHLARDDRSAAAEAFADGLAGAQEMGHRASVAAALVGLAEATWQVDEPAARAHLGKGVRVAVEASCPPYVMWAAFVAAEIVLAIDRDSAAARELLALAAVDPATEEPVRVRAAAVCEQLDVDRRPVGDSSPTTSPDTAEIGERVLELLLFG